MFSSLSFWLWHHLLGISGHQPLHMSEIFWFRHVELLVNLPYRYLTIGITSSDSFTISSPFNTMNWSGLFINCFANYWTFAIFIDIPNINITITINWTKDTRMSWTPLYIINILLWALKSLKWLRRNFRIPKFDGPIHRWWKHKIRHLNILFTLT